MELFRESGSRGGEGWAVLVFGVRELNVEKTCTRSNCHCGGMVFGAM